MDASSPRTSVDVPQNSPIPQFDFQLKVISDSYLSFFNERRRIEEAYVESMLKLHKRTRTIDLYLDDRPERSTVRVAWGEIRENVERETNARQAFLSVLIDKVIVPLTALKESQERTRKRVKEEIKDSMTAHIDFAENQLPKLKRAYLRKCQEVEDYKVLAAAQATNSSHAPIFAEGQRPAVTSPQPLRPVERKASLGSSSGLARRGSPPAADRPSLSDLAYQGKRQLNQLITFLDKSSTTKDGAGGRNVDSSLRTVRAKREADEADKEYRSAVYRLETLRLRRVRTLQAGYTSLERFYFEAAEVVKRTLESFTDNLMAATSTQSALAAHARQVVDQVSPTADLSTLAGQLPRLLQAAVPPQIFYYNYFVGECRELSFGLSLADYATTRSLPEGAIPRVLRLCIDEVDARGIYAEGIYRISGRHSIVQDLQHKLERDERNFAFNPASDDVHAVASLLKAYLRSLPEPLFKFSLQERLQHSEDIDEHTSNSFVILKSKIRRLPPIHRNSLKALVEHLARISSHSDKNKMDAKNLAIIFGTVVFGEEDIAQGSDLLAVGLSKDTVMEDLIENADILFQPDDRERGLSQLPLEQRALPPAQSQPQVQQPPATPVTATAFDPNDSATVRSRPSVHSRTASVQSSDNILPPSTYAPAEPDFTPELPPRPASSIHPSACKLDTPVSPTSAGHRPSNTLPPVDSGQRMSPPLSRPPSRPAHIQSRDSVITLDSELTSVAVAAMAFTQEEAAQASELDNTTDRTISARGSRPVTPADVQIP